MVDVAGAAVLLDFSTLNSSIQPIIRDSMKRLIMSSSKPESSSVLKMIQENVGIFKSMYRMPILLNVFPILWVFISYELNIDPIQ